jgi:hypothetical protein
LLESAVDVEPVALNEPLVLLELVLGAMLVLLWPVWSVVAA